MLINTHYPKQMMFFPNLVGGEKFTKIDLHQAYLQRQSKPLLTINTHKVLYRYSRMTYGISLWQRTIDTILQGLPGVQCILDDMIITGRNDSEKLQKLNIDKCFFMKDRVTYCGHEIDKSG